MTILLFFVSLVLWGGATLWNTAPSHEWTTRTLGVAVMTFAAIFLMGLFADVDVKSRTVPRYCAAELAPLADTVEYLRENRECVDVVLDNEGGSGG